MERGEEMIKNIILDMGNVLFDFDPEFVLDTFCSSDEEKNVIRDELFNGPEWIMADRGDIKDRERFDLVKVRVPEKYHDALWKCSYGWNICMRPVAGARQFCEYVKEHGYRVFVLSNASDLFYEYFPRLLPLDFFDGIFLSADYHMLKPDREIYEKFLEVFGLNGSECLFIDDRQVNVDGAIRSGINAVRFAGDFEPVKDLLQRGI